MVMSTHGEGSSFGLGSGDEPIGERTARVLSLCWIMELEGVYGTSPYPIGAKVRFALDLLHHATRSCWDFIAQFIMLTELETMSW